jgi:hypothetical protein
MEFRSPAPKSRDRLDPWREQLDAIEAADRHMVLTATASTSLIALIASIELMSFVSAMPTVVTALSTTPGFKFAAGAIALICAGYIGFSLYRRQRDVMRNDLRALRQQIEFLSARRALAPDAAQPRADL